MTQPNVYHPHRRDRGQSYYGDTWATAQHRRAHRIGRRLFRLLVIVLALAPFAAAAVIMATGQAR